MIMDSVLLEAVLFASLQTDHLAPHKNGDMQTSYPAHRFAAIALKIREEHPKIANRHPGSIKLEEAWEIVDTACKKSFGYSVCEQIEADIDHFEKQTSEKIYGKVPDEIELIHRDYLSMRRRILGQLHKSPSDIASNEYFVFSTYRQITPNYVICASSGQLGDPREGYHRLMGYQEPDRDAKKAPYLKWWWACSPDQSKTKIFEEEGDKIDDLLRFEHQKSWYSLIDFYAPTAKLLMNGRRIRTMLGPELMFAKQRIKTLFGEKSEIYLSFEFPEEMIDPNVLYFYNGRDTLKCDLSSTTIRRPEGKVLAPWTLRRWPRLDGM
jgi:hypothetical protein